MRLGTLILITGLRLHIIIVPTCIIVTLARKDLDVFSVVRANEDFNAGDFTPARLLFGASVQGNTIITSVWARLITSALVGQVEFPGASVWRIFGRA